MEGHRLVVARILIDSIIDRQGLLHTGKSISRIFFFDQIPFFPISKMAKNQFLKWENFQKMQFHEKKPFDLFDFTSFFAYTFLNFLV